MYDADLSGRTMAMLALGSAVYMVALAMAQAVIALQGHALVAHRLGRRHGHVRAGHLAVAATSCSGASKSAWSSSSVAALVAFALALRHRLRAGATPTQASMMEAITDMPFES